MQMLMRMVCVAVAIHGALAARAVEIAQWKMDEGTGDVAASTIGGSAADALFLGDPRWTTHLLPPVAGNSAAIQLEGDESFLQTDSLNGVLADGARTISAWVRTLSGQNVTLVDWGDEVLSGRFTLRLESSAQGTPGALRLEVAGGFATANTPVNDGQWHHVAVTLPQSGSVDDVKFYVDGVLDGDSSTVPFSGVSDVAIDTQPGLINIGQRVNGQFRYDGIIDQVRVWDEELSASAIASQVPAGPLPTIAFQVDRDTGGISLVNGYGVPIDEIVGYSIRSPVGALDVSQWTSVADNYDSDSGNPTFDSDGVWVKLTDTSEPTGQDLSEFTPSGDGGVLSTTTPLDLGNVWSRFPVEDLEAELIFSGGDRLPIAVEYVGNNDEPFVFGDLNFDGEIDVADWMVFRSNLLSTFSGLPTPQAYALGDLDFDGDNDRFDFEIFEALFDEARGQGALRALISGTAVPEPSSVAVLLMAVFGIGWRRCRLSCVSTARFAPGESMKLCRPFSLLCVCLLAVASAATARADLVAYYDFEGPNPFADKSLSGRDGMVTENTNVTTGPGLIGDALIVGAGPTPPSFAAVPDEVVVVPQAQVPEFGTGDLSVSLWYKRANPQGDLGTTGPTGAPDGIYDSLAGTTSGIQLFILSDGRVNGRFDAENGGFVVINSPPGAVEDNMSDPNTFQWHHIAYTLDRTSATPSAELYFNGVAVGSVANGNFNDILGSALTATQDLLIGAANEHPADGSIDDLAFFDQALTPQDITNLFQRTVSPIDFLLRPKLQVNTVTGEVTLIGNPNGAIDLDYYEIASASSALDRSLWMSLESQDLPGFPAGTGVGDGWEVAGGSSDAAIGEVFLDGFSTIDSSTPAIDLGKLFRPGAAQDLEFTYRDAVTGDFKRGLIDYLAALAGDYNGDGVVDAADYTVWRDTLGSTTDLAADGNGNNVIDAGDYDVWKQNFGAGSGSGSLAATTVAVPEPTAAALVLVAIGGLLGGRFASRLCLVALVSLAMAATATAGKTTDRLYRFGDDPLEMGSSGQRIVDNLNTNGFTFDSVGDEITGMMLSGAFIDLEANGDVSYGPGRTGGTLAAAFGGDGDYLSGLRLGFPETSATSTAATLSAEVTQPGPLDYVGISNRGFQLWVNPSTVGGATQTIVRDTTQHGLAIGASGNWLMRYAGQTVDTGVAATAGEWTHAMLVRPTLSQGARLYIDGVAVAAIPGGYNLADNSPLVVGANLDGGGAATEFFSGALDELEMFILGTSTDTRQRYGVFNPGTDNEAIAAQITTFGDINLDGNFDSSDVDAFVAGWLSENRINGLLVGDIVSYGRGDLNFDGIVDIGDAVLFNEAMSQAGMGNLFARLGATTVPEPSTAVGLGMLSLAGGGWLARRKQRGRQNWCPA